MQRRRPIPAAVWASSGQTSKRSALFNCCTRRNAGPRIRRGLWREAPAIACRERQPGSTQSHSVPARLTAGRGIPPGTCLLVIFPVTQKALSLPGTGRDLRKLVEQADRRPSPSQPVAHTHAGLSRRHRAVSPCLTTSGSLRGVLVTITVTRAGWGQRCRLTPTVRFSGRTYAQLARIVRALRAVAGRCWLPLVAAVAVTVAVSASRNGRGHAGSGGPGSPPFKLLPYCEVAAWARSYQSTSR